VGFEPTTPGLKVRSSSAELPARLPRIIAIFGHPGTQDARLTDQLPTKECGVHDGGRCGPRKCLAAPP
jgi:hypothetical protein